jgi:hypothetical protein
MGRHTDTGHALYIIFHVHIQKCWTDRKTLVDSIFQVEALTSTAEVQSIMHFFQEIHLIIRKYLFILQDLVETVAIDRVIGRFLVCYDSKFILTLLE